MPSNTKENGFETLIVDTLVNSNGYEQGTILIKLLYSQSLSETQNE